MARNFYFCCLKLDQYSPNQAQRSPFLSQVLFSKTIGPARANGDPRFEVVISAKTATAPPKFDAVFADKCRLIPEVYI